MSSKISYHAETLRQYRQRGEEVGRGQGVKRREERKRNEGRSAEGEERRNLAFSVSQLPNCGNKHPNVSEPSSEFQSSRAPK